MKPRFLLALVCALLLLPVSLQAQMPQQLFQIDIPFPFVAAGMHLPAGHYHISHPTDPNLLILQKDDNTARAVVYVRVSESGKEASDTKVVFNRYGNRYFLAQVWTAGDREVHESCKCGMERALIASQGKPEVTVILARK